MHTNTPCRLIGPLLTPNREGTSLLLYPRAVLEWDGQGAITRMERCAADAVFPHDRPTRDVGFALIVPGLVDLHSHIPQLPFAGTGPFPLLPWLEQCTFPEEKRFSAHLDHAASVAKTFVQKALEQGTTTLAAWSTSSTASTHAVSEAFHKSGLRGVVGKVLMDQGALADLLEDTRPALEGMDALLKRWHTPGRLEMAVTPRFALTSSRPQLAAAGDYRKANGLILMTHISESMGEIEALRHLHPWAKDYVDAYEATQCLSEKTLLAHAIHLSRHEMSRLRDAGCTVVHCPSSNMWLGSGIMPFREEKNRGLRVGLGTDIGAGPRLSLWNEMGQALLLARLRTHTHPREDNVLSPSEVFLAATRLGALALGWVHVGALEVGLQGDCAVVGLGTAWGHLPPQGLEALGAEELLGRLILHAPAVEVQMVAVGGRFVLDKTSGPAA